ncbi:MAG: efflux RND transporter periplasmic adaptor subunit [Halothiobacillus sp.]
MLISTAHQTPAHYAAITWARAMRQTTLAVIALGSMAMNMASARAENAPAKKMLPPIVPVASVQTQDVTVYETYTGTTEAHRQVDVRAQIEGILQSRAYTEGDTVKKGAPLFVIDDRPYVAALKEAQANVLSTQASLNAAQRDWNRINTLFGKGVSSVKDRDDAQSALEIAQAAVKVAQAKVTAAQINVDYTRVNAPISGIVGRRSVAAGNLIKVGDKLAQINDIDPIQAVFTTSADNAYTQLPPLNPTPANPTQAELLAGHDSTKPVVGELNYRAVSVDPSTNSVTLRGGFPNPTGAVKPNEFARIRVAVAQFPQALVIPQTALTSGIRPGSYAVFTVAANNTVTQTPVELGPMSDQGQIIRSGLKAGERIVTDGLVKLRPGITIEPFKPGAKP